MAAGGRRHANQDRKQASMRAQRSIVTQRVQQQPRENYPSDYKSTQPVGPINATDESTPTPAVRADPNPSRERALGRRFATQPSKTNNKADKAVSAATHAQKSEPPPVGPIVLLFHHRTRLAWKLALVVSPAVSRPFLSLMRAERRR